jgi:GH24 family phage-related lysozyme (muramidase)
MADSIELTLAQLRHFENSVPWMYLDSKANVTVGVGWMLPDIAAAMALPFVDSAGRPATRQVVGDDFGRVSKMTPARLPAFYRSPASPTLPQAVIDDKLRKALLAVDAWLRRRLPEYDAMPGSAKMALLDMGYNLGAAGLLGYPHLLAAVKAGDWDAASRECYRHGPGVERNAWTRTQFALARTQKP